MKHQDILKMDASSAIKAFGGTESGVKRAISDLIKEWHPDVCPHEKSSEVMSKLINLRGAVASIFAHKTITTRPQKVFKTSDGKSFGTRPLASYNDEVSTVYVGNASLLRVFDENNADLADRFTVNLDLFRYADDRMMTEFERFLPALTKKMTLESGQPAHVFVRRRDVMPLRHLMDAKGPMDPKTFAWVISGLLNVLCWANWSGVVHGAISPDSVMVSPELHETHLILGWEFAHETGMRPEVLPERTLTLCPNLLGAQSVMSSDVDLTLTKCLAQEMAGLSSVNAILSSPVPQAVKDWMISPNEASPVREYQRWKKALQLSYGSPKFVHMNATPEEIYEV